MDNNISFYLPENIAKPLSDQFGNQLEDMTQNIKLLLIHILAGGLHELEICPPLSDYSFIEYCHEQGMPDDLLDSVLPLLEQFDGYDASTIEKILMVLAISM